MIDGVMTFDEIINYLDVTLETKYKSLMHEFNNYDVDSNSYGLSKKEIKSKRYDLGHELAEIYRTYITYDTLLRKHTTFERRHIVRLFTEYYSALYNKPFTSVRIKNAIVVASVEDLGDSATLEEIDIKRLVEESLDTCIVFKNPSYTLLDGTSLSAEFAPFKEIMPVVRILVDLSLANPEMNDRLRISTALESAINDLHEQPKMLKKERATTE